MSTAGLVCLIAGISAVLAVIAVVGVRVFRRRMDIWAEKTIRSFFGSPEELVRRLREEEARKAQHESAKPADGESAPPWVGGPHWSSDAEARPQGADPVGGNDYELTR
jgi:hypothetical protein